MRATLLSITVFLASVQTAGLMAGERSAGQARAKSLTVKNLIELVTRNGQDGTIENNMAEAFGLGSSQLPRKRLRYKQTKSPDGREHGLSLLYASSDSKREKPTHLDLTVSKATKAGETWEVDGYVFLASLSGKLEKAFHNRGKAGDVNAETLQPDSATRKLFDAEMAFHQKTVPSLGLTPAE